VTGYEGGLRAMSDLSFKMKRSGSGNRERGKLKKSRMPERWPKYKFLGWGEAVRKSGGRVRAGGTNRGGLKTAILERANGV